MPRLCVVFLALLCLWSGGAVAREDGPNIVLFLVDDMGWRDSGAYGSTYYLTPAMDRLATQGMRFTDAYAAPSCSPTRASILTGQYPSRHRITEATGHLMPPDPDSSPYRHRDSPARPLLYADSRTYLDPALSTLAELLRDAGYRTGHFGKWHLGMQPEHWPDKQGFEKTWHCAPDARPPSYFSPYDVNQDGPVTTRRRVGNIEDGPAGEYITDRLTDEALAFIEAHREERFYLNLWHYGVHGPWGHKQEYTAAFETKVDPDNEQRNPIMASMLKSVDESLGRILEKLDEFGLTENTLFIFYSDNGGNVRSNTPQDPKMQAAKPGKAWYGFVQDWKKWAGDDPPTSNAPLREGKGSIYEGGQRVPLMVRWPGKIEPGSTSSTVVGAIDLFPTILAAAGLASPEGQPVDGLSLLPLLEQSGALKREAYFTWFPHRIPAVSVRRGDWKLIRRFEPQRLAGRFELFNLRDDVGEKTNLAPKMPERVAELDKLIDGFIEQTGALVPRPNPAYVEEKAGSSLNPGADSTR